MATLEFITSAARDEKLAPQLQERLTSVLDRYSELAHRVRADGESLPADEVGKLLAALDQGAGLILLAGGVLPDPAVFQAGMQRLIRSEEHTSELQSRGHLVCRLMLEKKKNINELITP